MSGKPDVCYIYVGRYGEMIQGLGIAIVMVSGLLMGICYWHMYSLVCFIREMEKETTCEKCERKDSCRALKSIGKSNWVTEFTYTTYLMVRKRCMYARDWSVHNMLISAVLNSVLYVVLYIRYRFCGDWVLYALATTILIYIGFVDWNTQYIPVEFNIGILILGFIRLALQPEQWLERLIGFLTVSLFMVTIDWIGMKIWDGNHVIGGGDIKLMAAAGLLLGWKLNIVAFMMGCIGGSIIHLVIMKIGKGNHQLAFGPYLAMGIYIAMICGEQLMSWYLGIMGL